VGEGWWRRVVVFGDGSVGQMVLVLFSFVAFFLFLWAVQDDSHDFLGGRWGGREGGGVGPLLWLLTFLQVFVGIVEEFEESRGFSCSEPGRSGVVLVWVVLVCELSVMHLDLHFGCAESKPKNF